MTIGSHYYLETLRGMVFKSFIPVGRISEFQTVRDDERRIDFVTFNELQQQSQIF